MPFAQSVPDVRLVQPVACRVVPKWSPGVRVVAVEVIRKLDVCYGGHIPHTHMPVFSLREGRRYERHG
jgi:hypothetical protein